MCRLLATWPNLRTRSNSIGLEPLCLRAMSVTRSLTHIVALVSLAAGLAGCGQVVGYPGAFLPAHTQSFPNESASPIPAGVDAMTGLQQRPMRPPNPAAHPGVAP